MRRWLKRLGLAAWVVYTLFVSWLFYETGNQLMMATMIGRDCQRQLYGEDKSSDSAHAHSLPPNWGLY